MRSAPPIASHNILPCIRRRRTWRSRNGRTNVTPCLTLSLLMGSLISPALAQDTTYTWNGTGTDNLWSDVANWLNSQRPVSGSNTAIDFQGTQTSSNANIANPFTLNLLQFDVAASTFTLQGGALNFVNNSSGNNPNLTFNAVNGIPSTAITIQNNITLTNSLAVTGSGVGSLTLAGIVSGPGELVMDGTGTLFLTNTANTFSGGLYLIAGTLNAAALGSLGTNTNLNFRGGTLQWGSQFNLGSAYNLLLTAPQNGVGGGTLDDNGYNVTVAGTVGGVSGLTINGSGTLALTTTAGNSYYGTTINGGTLVINSDGDLGQTVAGTAYGTTSVGLTFNGGTLQLGVTPGSGTFAFSANRTFTLNSGNNTLNTNGYDATIATAITGAGGLTKAGNGALTLSGANTYTGDTSINDGSIVAGSNTPLGTGTVTINVDNGLNLNGKSGVVLGGLAGNGALSLGTSASNGLEVGGDNATTTYSGLLSGAGQLGKAGIGTLFLTNTANTFSGGLYLIAGTLNAAALGSLGTNTTLTFNGGTLQWGSQFNLGSAYFLDLKSPGDSPEGNTLDDNGYNVTVAGQVGGVSGLTINGSGTLALTTTAGNSYYGTTINGGTLVINSDGDLGQTVAGTAYGTTSVGLTFNGGTLQLGVTPGSGTFAFSANRTFTLNSGNNTLNTNGYDATIATAITGAGGLTKAGSGTLFLTATANTYEGPTYIDGGTLNIAADGSLGAVNNLNLNGGTLQWAGSFDLDNHRIISLAAAGGTFDTNGNNTTISSPIQGSGALTKTGNGTLTLSTTANAYNGGTFLSGGTLNIAADGSLGGNHGGLTLSGGTLQWGGSFAVNNTRTLTLTSSGGSLDSNGYNAQVAGVISGTGSLTKLGTGSLTLKGANTFTGDTQIDAGSIVLNYAQALQDSTVDINVDNGLNLGGHSSVTLGGLAGSGAFNAGATALTIGGDNATTTYSGLFSGTGGLTKAGTGALTLTNSASTETGAITVNAGTLTLQASTYSNLVTVNNGGTLNYNGTQLVLGGGSSTYLGSTANPGGLLEFNGSATVVPGNTVELNGGQLINNGTIDGRVDINNGSLAKGAGNYAGGYNITSGGSFLPGNSPGTVTSGSATWGAGGKYTFQLNDANGTAGTNWGLNQINGQLNITAGKTPASLFTLAVQSLAADDTPGNAASFNPTQGYTWTFVTTTQGIVGFDPAEFSLDTSGFSNPVGGGTFSLLETGNGDNLSLVFTPAGAAVPEGSTLLSAGLMLLTGGMLLRRKRQGHCVRSACGERR